MGHEVIAAAQPEFFGYDTKSAVGCDEIRGVDARIAIDGEQQAAKKSCAAGTGGGDGQVLR